MKLVVVLSNHSAHVELTMADCDLINQALTVYEPSRFGRHDIRMVQVIGLSLAIKEVMSGMANYRRPSGSNGDLPEGNMP